MDCKTKIQEMKTHELLHIINNSKIMFVGGERNIEKQDTLPGSMFGQVFAELEKRTIIADKEGKK